LKEIAALPLVLGGVRWPVSEREWEAIGPDPDPVTQWTIGSAVLYRNDHDRVLLLARLPILLMALFLGGALFLWGREMLGPSAALLGTLLFVLDPTIVAHGILVTTDIGLALFTLLFLWAAWRYMNRRTLERLALCALALGAALAAKFTGLALPPIFFLLLLLGTRLLPPTVPRQSSTLVDPFASAAGGPRLIRSLQLVAALTLAAGLVVWACYFFRSPLLYLEGLQLVNSDHDPNTSRSWRGRSSRASGPTIRSSISSRSRCRQSCWRRPAWWRSAAAVRRCPGSIAPSCCCRRRRSSSSTPCSRTTWGSAT
jgi:hypothetical protein